MRAPTCRASPVTAAFWHPSALTLAPSTTSMPIPGFCRPKCCPRSRASLRHSVRGAFALRFPSILRAPKHWADWIPSILSIRASPDGGAPKWTSCIARFQTWRESLSKPIRRGARDLRPMGGRTRMRRTWWPARCKPHGGLLFYRGFVYDHHMDWRNPKNDRARAADDNFRPLDGKFEPNAVVQIKNGPIDFQVREPASPLFGTLEKTNQAIELQITQEYFGQARHTVFLAPMWKEVLDFDMHVEAGEAHARKGAGFREDVPPAGGRFRGRLERGPRAITGSGITSPRRISTLSAAWHGIPI